MTRVHVIRMPASNKRLQAKLDNSIPSYRSGQSSSSSNEAGVRKRVRVLAITPHKSVYPEPVEFEEGDLLELGRKDTEYPGWIWVRTSKTKEGWAPEQYIEITGHGTGVGLKNYTARELNTETGEELNVICETNGWYWVEDRRGEKGWVPVETTKSK